MNERRTALAAAGPSRRSAVRPFVAMDVLSAANRLQARGERVIHMEIGQPSAPTPRAVLAAARNGLAADRLGYTEALGNRDLRRRIARHYADTYRVAVDPDRIAITTGSSAAFTLGFIAAFDPGDRIVVTSPSYPAYRNIMMALGLEPVEVALSANAPVMTADQLREAHRAKPVDGILIASPANPTGAMLSPAALAELMATADELGIRFISDEIYHGLVYAGVAATALGHSSDAIVVNSFSKYYCMSGWRVGWMVLPANLVRPVERLSQNLDICPPDLSQRAAIAAFDAIDELEEVKAGYARSRALLLQHLPRLGFDEIYPVDGAFYVYGSVRRLSDESADFAQRMLSGAGVAATPGVDFDPVRGSGSIRFSFSCAPDDAVEAVERLEAWLR